MVECLVLSAVLQSTCSDSACFCAYVQVWNGANSNEALQHVSPSILSAWGDSSSGVLSPVLAAQQRMPLGSALTPGGQEVQSRPHGAVVASSSAALRDTGLANAMQHADAPAPLPSVQSTFSRQVLLMQHAVFLHLCVNTATSQSFPSCIVQLCYIPLAKSIGTC